jgi:L-Ala-D/L-Glu epimerase
MQLQVKSFTVNKRVPLTISRGTTAQTTNVWVRIEQDGIEGWGEASPFSVDNQPQTTALMLAKFQQIAPLLAPVSPIDRQKIEFLLRDLALPSAVWTGLDLALHDWFGKKVGLPLWQIWGLDRTQVVPTSVTIGISTPEAAQQRMLKWLELGAIQAVKVKLGSPAGLDADRAMFKAVLEVAPQAKLSVDANGGWGVEEAIAMSHWLADLGVTYIEQPLPRGREAVLPMIYHESPLPIFVDESCFNSHDIPKLSDRVHGINIKLMKSGGLTEALRMVHTAQAHGLQIMFGCYSDSSLSNTAAAQLAPFATHLDLDSHLNLLDDPFQGASFEDGYLRSNDLPGLGVVLA